MKQLYDITPPPELVASLRNSAPHDIRDAGVTRELWLINKAYAAGADQELEACCEVMRVNGDYVSDGVLRAIRRPKPWSRKEQALEAISRLCASVIHDDLKNDAAIVRRALEALDD